MQTKPDAEAYPLYWPEGWERTRPQKRRRARYQVNFARARDEVLESLRKMRAKYPVISTNIPLRRDGLPYANRPEPDDPGVAVYWMAKDGSAMSIACDHWDRVKDNLRAVGMALEALRQLERCGASQILDRAFGGFKALPSGGSETIIEPPFDWREELGLTGVDDDDLDMSVVDGFYKRRAKNAHPDRGGSHDQMTRLNRARDEANAYLRKLIDDGDIMP